MNNFLNTYFRILGTFQIQVETIFDSIVKFNFHRCSNLELGIKNV